MKVLRKVGVCESVCGLKVSSVAAARKGAEGVKLTDVRLANV